ncbi:hypothetical protein B0O99DRAFT_499689 [Bisporella sp. PMI_857]|nr:hypothetical protein B0O99DRAFT_499689 [Bisporella sp. PMI_857]
MGLLGLTRKPATSNISNSKEPNFTVITADLLIPGDGQPKVDAGLVISEKTIVYVGGKSDIPKKYLRGKLTKHHVPVLMPGLWDAHIHMMGPDLYYNDYTAILSTHAASQGARLARECWEALQHGYTSIRDVGGYGCEVAKAIDDGTIVGPNIYSAGACISQTGGHGDIHSLPIGDVYGNLGVAHPHAGHYSHPFCVADGPEEVRRAVRLQIRRGAKVIKVLASGGIFSKDDNPKFAQFSNEELRIIVEEAERQGRIVSAHVHGKSAIIAAIEAGCKTLEHVSYGDEEVFKLMIEKDIAYVATRGMIDLILATNGKGLPVENWEKLKATAEAHLKAYQGAVEAGVKMILGIDSGPGPWSALELQSAVEKGGMSPLEAIKAATANGPLSIGPEMASLSGQLKEGYDADIIALEENPLTDIKVLQDRKVITHVWKGGKQYKGPGIGPWGEE